jgi:RNA polymerase sigma-70 factor (ECF subfamily)
MQPGEPIRGERQRREAAWVAAVLAGDERAWRAGYDEAFPDLYRYVLWRSGGLHDLADEAVQETWLTAVRRLRAFDPAQGTFLGWLRGIAANVLRNQLRARRRRVAREQPLSNGQSVPDSPPGPQRSEAVARALDALPERYEAVLRAKYLEGQSVAAVAEAGGMTVKAAESLLTRARQAFREAYSHPE